MNLLNPPKKFLGTPLPDDDDDEAENIVKYKDFTAAMQRM
jgi:hypothetical protein